MSRENFRDELRRAFDGISGTPSPALSARVRSALVHAPERRGQMWIAGLAAAAIVVIVIGVLVVAGPLRRLPLVPAGPTSSPSVSPTPSPVSSRTADANLPPFICGSMKPIIPQQAPLTAYIDAVRTGSHTGYDRITIEFQNGPPSSIEVRPQGNSTFTQGASGQSVTLAGNAGLLIIIRGADEHTAYSGSTDFKTAYPVLLEARQMEDFEGTVQWGLGLSKSACYRAFFLANPTRLVVDLQVS